MDYILDALDGLEVDSVLEIDQTLLLVLVGLLYKMVDIADYIMLQFTSLPGDLPFYPLLLKLELVNQLPSGQTFLHNFQVDLLAKGVGEFRSKGILDLNRVEQASFDVTSDLGSISSCHILSFFVLSLDPSDLIEQDNVSLLNSFYYKCVIILLHQLFPAYIVQSKQTVLKIMVRIENLGAVEFFDHNFIDILNELPFKQIFESLKGCLFIEVFPLLSTYLVFKLNQLIAENST